MIESKLSKYLNLYSISKTLRFELKPVGDTLKNFKSDNILEKDKEKALKSKEVKKILDEYYKEKIDEILNNNLFEKSILDEYIKNQNIKENIKIIKDIMKSTIVSRFESKNILENGKEVTTLKLLTSELVFKSLDIMLEKANRIEDLKKIKLFDKYTTYYTDFFKNREFIFKGKDQGSIAYRLIDENLDIFMDNLNNYNQNVPEEIKNKFNNKSIDFLVDIESFNSVLTQKGIELYNLLISGQTLEKENKVQGLNELINLHNQLNKTKIPLMKILNKQILSDKQTFSFVLDIIEDDETVFALIDEYIKNTCFINLFENKDINYDEVYITNNQNITLLSKKLLSNWNEIKNLLYSWYEKNIDHKTENKNFLEKRTRFFKNTDHFSIKFLSNLTDNRVNSSFFITESNDYILKIKSSIDEYRKIIRTNIKNLKKSEEAVLKIKALLDSIKEYQEFLKQFLMSDIRVQTLKSLEEGVNSLSSKDSLFYNDFDNSYNNIFSIVAIYDKIRNYLTKKPFKTDKIKINFNCSTLLNGWDLNKEKANLGVIFKKYDINIKKDIYFLGIIKDKKIFDKLKETDEQNCYEKMEYKLFPGANKMLPKIFISAKAYRANLSEEFLKNYSEKKHTKSNLDEKFLAEYILYMQKSLNDYYKDEFNFKFNKAESYKQIDEFYRDVEEQGYKLKFKKISESYINKCILENKLYLFQIYCKDFSNYSHGLPNTQTIYLQSLFSNDNLNNPYMKLLGNAEIFYREKSLEIIETHKANEQLQNKNVKNLKKKSQFNYSLIKDKRYTEDKFLFHFPITINYKSGNIRNINQLINANINDFEHVIGIDRGERNLVYIVVSDLKGNIKDQISLNEIVNSHNENEYRTDYNDLLEKKAKGRDEEKKNWSEIENIKELKEGYISQVVSKIKDLALKYNALIVLENLNFGFKNSRIKVEKQVYQRLETQLINKLNYVIDKKDSRTYLNGIQLTNPINNLSEIGSQSGIVIYIPAWNTSKIDPTTGFVNLIYGLKYKNIADSKEFISKIKDIRFNGKYYEFDIDFGEFNNKLKETKLNWTICTYGTRVETRRDEKNNNEWVSKEVDLTKRFEELLKKYNIHSDFKNQILLQNSSDFFEEFIHIFKLILQIRNSIVGTKIDYMISPVKNPSGKFFDTREGIKTLPLDADANGAYNIARKGIMIIDRIKNTTIGEKIDYKISNEEYLLYLQNQ